MRLTLSVFLLLVLVWHLCGCRTIRDLKNIGMGPDTVKHPVRYEP